MGSTLALTTEEIASAIGHDTSQALKIIGGLTLTQEDIAKFGLSTDAQTAFLLAPNGQEFWHIFQNTPEFKDGGPDPLDRWSRRVIDRLANQLGARAVFPFGGPPYLPFYSWALSTGRVFASPINLLTSQSDGLWVSLRGALIFDEALSVPAPQDHPCETCKSRACLAACPVGALTREGYDVAGCTSFLRDTLTSQCQHAGCRARQACPLSKNARRLPEQSKFHMQAFLGS